MSDFCCGCSCDHEPEERDNANTCGCGDECQCGDDCHCENGHHHDEPMSPESIDRIKATLKEAGYEFEETPSGEIRILEK